MRAENLNLLSTHWSLVHRAHNGPAELEGPAREQLLQRYGDAVRRYLVAVVRDPDGVDEVFQEFALNLLHGDFRGATPQRGRFRNFVKGTLFHLIADYYKRRQRLPERLPAEGSIPAAIAEDMDSERSFVESWCDHLLARAWAALAAEDRETGRPNYAVLRFRADHPEMRAPELAKTLGTQLDRTFSAAAMRQILRRARRKFAVFLLDEVEHSLEDPTFEEMTEELAELGLLEYCKSALEQRQQNA
jgi:RNA polymerase sigma-70 factor (ECF subfamily)